MFVQIHTDRQIDGGSERAARVEDRVRERLARFEDRLTHIEIHVTDMNGGKGASGLRATLERSEEHTSELQSLMRISYAVFCLKTKKIQIPRTEHTSNNKNSNT